MERPMSAATRTLLSAWLLCSACGEDDAETGPDLSMLPGQSRSPDAAAATNTPDATVLTTDSGAVQNNPQADATVSIVDSSLPATWDSGSDAASGDSGTPPGPPPTACSGTATGTPGSTQNLMLNGRQYTLHIGKTVKAGSAAPLIFSLHGLTMTPASMELMAGWDPIADKEGLIIARPAGVGSSNGWDLTTNKDFDLMKAIIEDVNAKACVDRKRIYATGFSHGGFMSFAIACKLGDLFAAVAPAAGSGSAARGCVARAVPVYAFHGDADNVVSYSSGKSAVDGWITHDKCTGSPTSYKVSTSNCQAWTACAEGSAVKFCTAPGAGHTYPRFATAEILTFFKEHPLP
jgi:polyhydroxybutyrate depolymerase